MVDDKTTSLSGNHSDDKFENSSYLKKVVKIRSKRNDSTISSNSGGMIKSYRTAQVVKQTLNTPSITPNKMNIGIEKCGFKEDKFEEIEQPVSFRDNIVEESEQIMKLECDSDFDYQQFENKLKENKQSFKITQPLQSPIKIKMKKLSKMYNKKAIMKMFDHIESQILYSSFNSNHKQDKVIYLEDEEDRIWEIRKNESISPRSLNFLSSLKSLDSPLSVENYNFRLSPSSKNKTIVQDFEKISIEIGTNKTENAEEGLNKSESEQVNSNQLALKDDLNSLKEKSEVIDYESMEEIDDELISFEMGKSEKEQEFEMNCLDLY